VTSSGRSGRPAAALGDRQRAWAAFGNTLALVPQHTGALDQLARQELRRGSRFQSPEALARAVTGFARAVRTDPRATISRRKLDDVAAELLRRVVWWLLLAVTVALRQSALGNSSVGRIVPVGLLLLPVVDVLRLRRRLPPELRTRFVRLCTGPSLPAADALVGLAVLLLLVGAVLPAVAYPSLAWTAAGCVFLSVLLLRARARRRMTSGPLGLLPRGDLTDRVAWLVLAALVLGIGVALVRVHS